MAFKRKPKQEAEVKEEKVIEGKKVEQKEIDLAFKDSLPPDQKCPL